MINKKFGLVGWDEETNIPGNKQFDNSNKVKDEFLKLQPGSNEVRIVTRPYQYVVHKYKLEGWKSPFNIRCTMTDDCPLCAQTFVDEKGKTRKKFPQKEGWYVGVIDRKTGRYKVLGIGQMIYKKIKNLNNNKAWGAPDLYDVDIIVDPNGGATGYYDVTPLGKQPLSDADVDIKKNVNLESLKKKCDPLTVEGVERLMAFAENRVSGNGKKVTPSGNGKSAVQAQQKEEARMPDPVMGDENDEEFEFPPANVDA